MLCDICHNKQAKIFYTEIINGEKREQHLCEDCAGEYAAFSLKDKLGNDFPLSGILSGILSNYAMGANKSEDNQQSCPRCGMTFEQFKKTGKLGCAECYNTFAGVVDKNLRSIQGADQHKGKRPHNASMLIPAASVPADVKKFEPEVVSPSDLKAEGQKIMDVGKTPAETAEVPVKEKSEAELRELMNAAVAVEDYKEAARLRDLIRSMKKAD